MFTRTALILIRIYRKYLGHALPRSCRFAPSCSEYAGQAILKYGFFGGSVKAIKRLLSCHPFSKKAGYDPLI